MRKLLYLLVPVFVLLTACNSSTSSSGRLSKGQFCALYRDSMRHRFPRVKFEIVDERTIRSFADGKEGRYYIDNAYTTYLATAPDSLGQVLHRYANSAADVYELDVAGQTENVVPVIRAAKDLEGMLAVTAKLGAKKGVGMLHESYNDDLMICYAIDTKSNIRYMQEKDLETLKLSTDSLREIAMRNLARKLNVRREGDKGIYMWVAGGNYEASLILLKELWTKEKLPVEGDFVIAIPSRDVLLVTGSKNKDGIKKLQEFTKKTYDGGTYSVSEDLFKWDGKKFSKFEG